MHWSLNTDVLTWNQVTHNNFVKLKSLIQKSYLDTGLRVRYWSVSQKISDMSLTMFDSILVYSLVSLVSCVLLVSLVSQVSRAGQGHQAQQGRHPQGHRHLRQDPQVRSAQEAAAGGDLQAAAGADWGAHWQNQGKCHILQRFMFKAVCLFDVTTATVN